MYTAPPVTGILFGTGQAAPQQLADKSLCKLAEAQFIQKIFGGTLVNAAGDPAIGTFVNLDPASEYQPWILLGPNNAWDGQFVGPRVAQMDGIDTKGTWSGIGTGNPVFTPAPPPPPPPAPKVDHSGDVGGFMAAENVPAPGAATGSGDQSAPTDAATLNRIEAKLDAIMAWQHIPYTPK